MRGKHELRTLCCSYTQTTGEENEKDEVYDLDHFCDVDIYDTQHYTYMNNNIDSSQSPKLS